MGRGIFNGMPANLQAAADDLADNRREGSGLKYRLAGALKSALPVFFFQHPSMLGFQNKMKQTLKRNNLETTTRVKETPSNVRITALPDGIGPDSVSAAFNKNLQEADRRGSLKGFRCLGGGALTAPDGVRCFS